MKMLGIILVLAALAAGMAGCVRLPARNLQIRDWYDLDAVRHNLRGNHRLMNDLDAATAGYEELASPTANNGTGWQPIGGYSNPPALAIRVFEGTFDGQGYQIRGLFINRPDEYFVGLFGAVDGSKQVGSGVVANVGVVNATVTGGSYVGALVGYMTWLLGQPGTVSNCYATGSVAGNLSVGGLVGLNMGTVSDSYCSGNVTGLTNVGGLVGFNDDTVSSCYSSAWVTGEQSVGGLVGANEAIVSDSFWDVEASTIEESDGGTGKSTAEMKDIATFTDTETEGLDEPWDITAVAPGETNLDYVWNIVDGETYPFLSWESVA